jgi:hypothetical protein
MKELLFRFLVGGVVVATFSALGDTLKPKSFAGLFGAAPSVALATLALTVAKDGVHYTTLEARSMLAGAVALGFYSYTVMRTMAHHPRSALRVSIALLSGWFVVALGIYFAVFKTAFR